MCRIISEGVEWLLKRRVGFARGAAGIVSCHLIGPVFELEEQRVGFVNRRRPAHQMMFLYFVRIKLFFLSVPVESFDKSGKLLATLVKMLLRYLFFPLERLNLNIACGIFASEIQTIPLDRLPFSLYSSVND